MTGIGTSNAVPSGDGAPHTPNHTPAHADIPWGSSPNSLHP
ncbi:hypothetical protein [Streptomyces sp. NPDC056982]